MKKIHSHFLHKSKKCTKTGASSVIGDMEQSEKSEPESDNEPSMANLLAGEWSKK